MKYSIYFIIIFFCSCNNQESTQLTQKEVVSQKKENVEKEVKIKLPSSPSVKKKPDFQENKEGVWVKDDSLLISNFVESLLAKNQVKFDKYLHFFGDHSEFEIEELLSKFGDAAEEKSQLIYSNAAKYNSLSLEKIRSKILGRTGEYQSLELLEFDKKNVDINYFKLKVQGTNLTEEYYILTNSSEGRSRYIVDVLSNGKSIINNQSYN